MRNDEARARRLLIASAAASIFAAAAAIMLATNGNRNGALVALGVAVAWGTGAWFAYRRYTTLRRERWRAELSHTDLEMQTVLGDRSNRQGAGDEF